MNETTNTNQFEQTMPLVFQVTPKMIQARQESARRVAITHIAHGQRDTSKPAGKTNGFSDKSIYS